MTNTVEDPELNGIYGDRSISFKDALKLKLKDMNPLKAQVAFEISYCLPLDRTGDTFTLVFSKKDADNINKVLTFAWLNLRKDSFLNHTWLIVSIVINFILLGELIWR